MSEIHYYERPILPVRYPQRHRRALAGGGGSTISSTARLLSQPSLEFLNLAPGLYEIPSMFKKWDSHGCRRGAGVGPGRACSRARPRSSKRLVVANADDPRRDTAAALPFGRIRRVVVVVSPRPRRCPRGAAATRPRNIREAPRGGAER